eukprot:scaffold276330_cov24-Tisochrysis_lutea.AAC.1
MDLATGRQTSTVNRPYVVSRGRYRIWEGGLGLGLGKRLGLGRRAASGEGEEGGEKATSSEQ